MGIIENLFGLVFGDASRRTIEVFRENAENLRSVNMNVMRQRLTIFVGIDPCTADRFAVSLMTEPVAATFDGLWCSCIILQCNGGSDLVCCTYAGARSCSEPLWWLLGAVISFYFGARHQAKGQAFQKSLLDNMALMPSVSENINMLEDLRHQNANMQKDDLEDNRALSFAIGPNAAVEDWKKLQKRDK